jgi:hypothetical protein
LAGEAHSQLCTVAPSSLGCVIGLPLLQEIRNNRLDDLANQRRLTLANRLGDLAAQFALSWNKLLMIV